MDTKKLLLVAFVIIIITSSLIVIIISNPPEQPTNGDTTGPIITITGPAANATVYGAEAITFKARDNSSIQRFEIYIDGVLTAVGQSFNWNTRSVDDGQHNITCRARDEHSNWGESTITVTVDNTISFTSGNFDPIFKVMAYNIQESGINPDWMEVVKEENPDIAIIVETGFWDDAGSDGLNDVVAELNTYFVNENPYEGFCAQGIAFSTSGEAVLSRFPVVNFRQIQVVHLDDETGYDVTHDFIDALIDINGTEVHFVGCHLKAGGTSIDADRREFENEGIINYFDSLGDVPIVYLGDLNSYSPVDTGALAPNDPDAGVGPLTMLIEPDDPTYGQYSSEVHNFTDVFRQLNPTDPGYTFGHQFTPLLGRIDYIITNQFFENMLINSTVDNTPHSFTGSDHYCVDAFINWTARFNATALRSEPRNSVVTGQLPGALRLYTPDISSDQIAEVKLAPEPVSWFFVSNYGVLVKD